jgi:hypothetical protein
LATIEAEIAKLDERLTEMNRPRDLAVSLDDLRQFLYGRAAEIAELLRGDVEIARLALAKHVDRLVLTPKIPPDGPLLEVSGDIEIFNGNEEGGGGASVMAARDGIERPTPAFSGPPSSRTIGLESMYVTQRMKFRWQAI